MNQPKGTPAMPPTNKTSRHCKQQYCPRQLCAKLLRKETRRQNASWTYQAWRTIHHNRPQPKPRKPESSLLRLAPPGPQVPALHLLSHTAVSGAQFMSALISLWWRQAQDSEAAISAKHVEAGTWIAMERIWWARSVRRNCRQRSSLGTQWVSAISPCPLHDRYLHDKLLILWWYWCDKQETLMLHRCDTWTVSGWRWYLSTLP